MNLKKSAYAHILKIHWPLSLSLVLNFFQFQKSFQLSQPKTVQSSACFCSSMSSTSKKFLEVTLSEETEFSLSDEEADNRMEILEENLINLTLVSKAEDDDHGRLFRKRARAKKVRDRKPIIVCSLF